MLLKDFYRGNTGNPFISLYGTEYTVYIKKGIKGDFLATFLAINVI